MENCTYLGSVCKGYEHHKTYNLATPPQQLGYKSKFIKSFSVSMFIYNKVTKQSTVHRLCTFSNICHTHRMTLLVILLSYNYQSCEITKDLKQRNVGMACQKVCKQGSYFSVAKSWQLNSALYLCGVYKPCPLLQEETVPAAHVVHF